MDPRHTLYKTFDKLAVGPANTGTMSARTDDEAAQAAASSGVTPEGIEKKLKEGLGAVYVEIADLSGMLHFCFGKSSWCLFASYSLVVDLVFNFLYQKLAARRLRQCAFYVLRRRYD